jgi:cytochrome c oxidase subunit 3/cytochrome o ubiquinol oxidase subunit 3
MATVDTAAPNAAPAHTGGHYTTTGLDNRKIAIWAFIGSECMLFTSLISTYLIYKGRSLVGPFPHETWTDPATGKVFPAILNIPVTSASTFVLLMSSLAMVLAHDAVVNAENPKPEVVQSSKLWLGMDGPPRRRLPRLPGLRVHLVRARGADDPHQPVRLLVFTLTGFHGRT